MTRLRLLLGFAAMLSGCSALTETPPTTSSPGLVSTSVATAPVDTTTTTPATDATTTVTDGWYVVTATAGLPKELSSGLAKLDGVDVVSVVRVENLRLVETRDAGGAVVDRAPGGFVIPLEAHAIAPQAQAGYVPESVARLLMDLEPDEAVLSESSATFRRLGPGSELVLDGGTTLKVVAVVADEWVGAAEVAVSASGGLALDIQRDRYAIVRFEGSRTALEQASARLAGASVRVRARDEVDVFRHANAVASQVAIKMMFGEFAYRPGEGDEIEIDPEWVEANIVTEDIPLLGTVKCHRRFTALLREVMTDLEDAGSGDAIDAAAYLGCWNPRFIRGRRDLSRHAWGVAADINFGNETDGGAGSPTHPALIEAMLQREILSGYAWTDPDPGHFEWFGDPP